MCDDSFVLSVIVFLQAALDFMSRGHMLPDVVALIGKLFVKDTVKLGRRPSSV